MKVLLGSIHLNGYVMSSSIFQTPRSMILIPFVSDKGDKFEAMRNITQIALNIKTKDNFKLQPCT